MDLSNNFLLGVFLFYLTLNQNVCHSLTVEVTPREILVLPGQNVTAMCSLPTALQYCRVEVPTLGALNLNSKLSNPLVTYHGEGLAAGHCGFTIRRVTDAMNGPVRCTLGVATEVEEGRGAVQLVVARAPRQPEMEVARGADAVRVYKLHDVLEASCLVKDGRPVANISWFLDEAPLPVGEQRMPTVVDLAKENLQSKLQNVSRVLQAGDNGRHLRCVAYHPAYPGGQAESRRQLEVKYPPLPQRELDKFGYTIGQPGLVTIALEANPKPKVVWQVAGDMIRESENDRTGRITAEPLRELGLGRYEASLRIAAISKHDTDANFVLRAYNDMGNQDYTVKISTSPEPEGVELGIGGIVGIVIAILVLLLAVFLLVFAKLTGRWCFSDGATVIDYTTGDHLGPPSDGVDNPHHQVSQEYINGNDLIGVKEKKIDTAV